MLKTAIPKHSKHPYISINPKISGGSPVISGTRLRVIDLVIEYDRLGLTPDSDNRCTSTFNSRGIA